MRKLALVLVVLIISVTRNTNMYAQVSVYGCEVLPTITQSDVNNSGETFSRDCIELGVQTITVDGSTKRNFYAINQIHLINDVHFGGFNEQGSAYLKILPVPNPDSDVALMNYDSLGGILKLAKLELGLKLPQAIQDKIDNFINKINVPNSEKINPYLDWEIKVEAEFHHAEVIPPHNPWTPPHTIHTNIKMDGFYAKDYISWQTNNLPAPINPSHGYYPIEYNALGGWKEDTLTEKKNYPFRIRFAPTMNGDWQCVIKVYLNDGSTPVYTAPEFTFNVIESNKHGYVKAGKHFLMQDNKTFFPLGCNIPWPQTLPNRDPELYEKNGRETYKGQEYCIPRTYQKYKDEMQKVKQNGGNLVRSMMYPNSTEIEWEEMGNYTRRLAMAQEMDDILEYAEDNELYLDWNMQVHYPFIEKSSKNYDVNWSWDAGEYTYTYELGKPKVNYEPFCYQTLVGNPLSFLTNPTAKKYYKQRIRYILSRWGYSTNIALFELFSEINTIGASVNPITNDDISTYDSLTYSIYQAWQTEMAAYIKSFHNGVIHPLGSGYTTGGPENGDDTYDDPNFDVITYTWYDYNEPDFAKGIITDVSQRIAEYNQPGHTIKPVILSETDVENMKCDDGKLEMKRYLWEVMFSGAAGAFSWNMEDNPQLYPTLGQMQNVLNSFNLDFEKDGWHPGSCFVDGANRWMYLASMDSLSPFNPKLYMDRNRGGNSGEYEADFIYMRSRGKQLGIGVATNKTYNIYNQDDCLGISALPSKYLKLKQSAPITLVDGSNQLNLSFTYMVPYGYYNTYYYPVNNPYISYGSTHRFTKMLPVSQASMGRLPLETTIQANENRYITLVATHLGQTSWRPENNEKDSLEEVISTDIKFYNEEQSDTLLQITDEKNQLEINIYPNPFDDQLTIENPYEEVVLELTTLDGKHIKDYHIRKGVQKITTQNVPKGFYMIKVSNQQRILINSKFLKL